MNDPIWLTIAANCGPRLIAMQRLGKPSELRAELSSQLDTTHGPGNWLIIPTDDLPAGFDPADFMVADGRLVPVTPAILAERERLAEQAALSAERDDLLRRLARSDYKALKFAEGSISEADFAPARTERQAWRERINEITKQLEYDN